MLVAMLILTMFGMVAGFALGYAWRSEVQLDREADRPWTDDQI